VSLESECHLQCLPEGIGLGSDRQLLGGDSVRQGVRILLPLAFPASLSFLVYKSQSLVLEQELLVGVAS
jgi:hypothetical protein